MNTEVACAAPLLPLAPAVSNATPMCTWTSRRAVTASGLGVAGAAAFFQSAVAGNANATVPVPALTSGTPTEQLAAAAVKAVAASGLGVASTNDSTRSTSRSSTQPLGLSIFGSLAPSLSTFVAGGKVSAANQRRVHIASGDVSMRGFALTVTTWSDTPLTRLDVAWVAFIGEDISGQLETCGTTNGRAIAVGAATQRACTTKCEVGYRPTAGPVSVSAHDTLYCE